MENVSIRYANESDVSTLVKESEAEWHDWWKANYRFGIKYTKDRIKKKDILVAVVKNKIVGFIIFGSLWSRHLHIEDLYVLKEFRNQGIASSLMKRFFEIAKKEGIRKILAESDPTDKPAHHLNLKYGFKRAGYIKNLWGETDGVVFIKNIK